MNSQFREFDLLLPENEYQPLIPGKAAELLECLESYRDRFPRSIEVFGGILQIHMQRHPLLEDWLIIPHFQVFWDANQKSLQWFEDLFDEVGRLLGISSWKWWLEEVIRQTDCTTTHALCDRLYDYKLQLYGGLYVARQGKGAEFILPSNEEKKPDVKGVRRGKKCVLEAKFVHTSEKYGSFWHRFNAAVFKYTRPTPRPLFCEQFRFPPSLNIKSLLPLDCTLIKEFTRKVFENPDIPQTGRLPGKTFVYTPSLPPALVPIDLQYRVAQGQGDAFACNYLKRLLNESSLQLKKAEYDSYEKILFIGLQPDGLYFAPWNDDVITIVKSTFIQIAKSLGIEVVFSEDVGFPVRDYV